MKKKTTDFFFKNEIKDETKNEAVEKSNTLTEVLQNLESQNDVESTEKTEKRGRKSKKQIENEKENEKKVLIFSTSLALISLSQLIAKILKDEKWVISDNQEANTLSDAIITYIDIKFPDWKYITPEFNLIFALSSYIIKRV